MTDQPVQETKEQPGYIKLIENRPVYEYNGRFYQLNRTGCPFDVTAVQPDPHLPGMLDLTDAICNITWEIHDAVHAIAREKGDIR
jgi:hypothetical protein